MRIIQYEQRGEKYKQTQTRLIRSFTTIHLNWFFYINIMRVMQKPFKKRYFP
jgi:hypothetical protein